MKSRSPATQLTRHALLVTSRREVLGLAIRSVGTLMLSAVFPPLLAVAGQHPSAASLVTQTPFTAWVRIASDGAVTLFASQSQMGQGITATLAAALADELYLPWERVKIEFAPFDPAYREPVYHWMFTGNSQSASSFYIMMHTMALRHGKCS